MAFRAVLAISLVATCIAQACVDHKSICPSLKQYCRFSHFKQLCPKTCNTCGAPPTRSPQPTPVVPSGPPPACGKPAVAQSRVIAGENAKPGAWPWQIAMYINGQFACGGSLVSPEWIVTAAHCVDSIRSPSAYSVVLGAQNLRQREPSWQHHRVSRIIIHPRWGRLNYDLALMKLAKPAVLNDRVRTVCLPQASEAVPVGTKCFITGWGKVRHPGNSYPILQQADLPVVSQATCNALNFKVTKIAISDVMVCAGHGPGNRKSGCHGDSGGPFVCPTGPGGAFQLHGAVSWGSARCNSAESYTVFARITALRSWINQNTGL